MVDVRDTARAHRLCLEVPSVSNGSRYILAASDRSYEMSTHELAAMLGDFFPTLPHIGGEEMDGDGKPLKPTEDFLRAYWSLPSLVPSLVPSLPSARADVATKSAALAACFASGSCPSVCDYFKRDSIGPFSCTKTVAANVALPTTAAEAIAFYAKNYPAAAICEPLKQNAPFQCTGKVPKPAAEILSLAWANTQLAFGVLGSLCVAMLYGCKKAKAPVFLKEQELQTKLASLDARIRALELP